MPGWKLNCPIWYDAFIKTIHIPFHKKDIQNACFTYEEKILEYFQQWKDAFYPTPPYPPMTLAVSEASASVMSVICLQSALQVIWLPAAAWHHMYIYNQTWIEYKILPAIIP